MAETKTKTQDAPQAAPPTQLPAKVSGREAWENFQDDLNKRADEIGSQLPANVSRERFMGASLAAVKATPAILTATPRSLMAALTKAAQDGLLPDGREGIITVYSTTIDNVKQQIAQWNPMFYGIRKRARELDGIIIDAQVVFTGDDFDYELGDNPFIKHKPKPRELLMDASAGIAVYAIFRHPEQGILHREVMWKPEVFATMNQSRAKGSLMWTTFWTEGWKKTVGRRGSKSVPVSPQLERLIQRDDENFTFATDHPKLTPPTPPSPPAEDEPDPIAPPDQTGGGESETSTGPAAEPTMPKESYFLRINEELEGLTTEDEVIAHYETLGVDAALAGNDEALDRAAAIRAKHIDRVTGQGSLLP